MPDSQNKQGEQKSSKCARCGIEYFDDNSPTALCGYCEADRRNALRRQGIDPDASLLSQQHAPSKEAGERLHEIAKKWYDKLEYGSGVDVWGMLISALTELATELTKDRDALREDMSGISDQHFREKLKLQEENSQLKQQLAEAKKHAAEYEEQECEEITSLQAQNIALSAVVEKMKRGLESIVHECGINPAGGYYIIAHAATQLLADLGQSK